MEVLQFSYDKNPNQFIALVGMVRAYSAKGEFTKAAEFAAKALPLAPMMQINKEFRQCSTNLKMAKTLTDKEYSLF
jgi:hypothetical protein